MLREKNGRLEFGGLISAWVIDGVGHGAPFCDWGDPGSLVLHEEIEAWVGTVFCSDRIQGWSYIVPADLVIKDIEGVTGARIVEPGEMNREDMDFWLQFLR
ncbi:hypothetical protein AJ79_07114 [Helicocarpus griseus UAMH5409]|uniref:Uncharacterized protein n=1 Tax=Helicocarpus griseus UAMH5409 TaxID=1447875 RepID=A0A2B7WYA1_9EURO|nr:hypothetical protein AJ79_07114 [Helicocarpus griseus UAMH5409]